MDLFSLASTVDKGETSDLSSAMVDWSSNSGRLVTRTTECKIGFLISLGLLLNKRRSNLPNLISLPCVEDFLDFWFVAENGNFYSTVRYVQ